MTEEPRVEEGQEESQTPTPAGEPAVDDRPEQNWRAEMDRKLGAKDEVINSLKSEIDSIKANQTERELAEERKRLEDKFADTGFDKDVYEIMEKQFSAKLEQALAKANASHSKEINTLKGQMYSSSRDRFLEDIKRDDKSGDVKKHFADIQQVVSQCDPEIWATRESMENVVGMVLGKIRLKGSNTVKTAPESPTQDSPTPAPVKGAKSAKKSTIDKYTDQFGDKAVEIASAEDELDKVMFGNR